MADINRERKTIKPADWLHTHIIALKDRANRQTVYFDCARVFGFNPQWIAISKVHGQNNHFVVSAQKTPEFIKMEEAVQKTLKTTKTYPVKKDKTPVKSTP